jgi:hypothetical protein
MSVLEPEAAQLLRRAVQIAGDGLVTVAHLRRAVQDPAETELSPARLRGDAAFNELVQRATALASQRAAHAVRSVSRLDLLTALIEAEASAAGLDLDRLRFARWRIEQTYPDPPQTRRFASDGPVTAGHTAQLEEAS